MKLAKSLLNLSYLGGVVAVFLRSQEISQWNIVGIFSTVLFVLAGFTWYSVRLYQDNAFIKHERMNPFIVFIKATLVIVGILGFIYTFTTRGTLFCTPWNGLRITFIVIGAIAEFIVILAYLHTFTEEIKNERSEIAV